MMTYLKGLDFKDFGLYMACMLGLYATHTLDAGTIPFCLLSAFCLLAYGSYNRIRGFSQAVGHATKMLEEATGLVNKSTALRDEARATLEATRKAAA